MYLIFFDIDGTLAMPGYGPSHATIEAIRACRAKGNKVFISTGRTEGMVPEAIAAIGFDGGIYSAGGRIVADGRELQQKSMPPELVARITEAMEKIRINYTMECEKCLYDGSVELATDGLNFAKGSSELQRVMEMREKLGDRYPFSQYNGEPVYKISFMATSFDQITALKRELDQEAKVVAFDNLMPGLSLVGGEVSAFDINKGAALEYLCDYFHTDVSQSIAFGDSMNDSEILQTAGIGVAMGTSSEEVKQLADRICGSCEQDGVAEMLKEMGLA
jgi:hypothetical protein